MNHAAKMPPTEKDILSWQAALVQGIVDKAYTGLKRGAFADDADPEACAIALEDEIVTEAQSFTVCDDPQRWKIQAGAAVMVASKMVMAHDYLPDTPELVKFIALIVAGQVDVCTKKALLCEEIAILSATVFRVGSGDRNTDPWSYDIDYGSDVEIRPTKRARLAT